METFPTEITAEILSRLPVNSLLRFKSVCKSWYSLINTPNFIKLHLNQTLISNSNLHLLIYYPFLYFAEFNHQISFSKLPHPLDPRQVRLFGSCNGVICISDPSKSDIFLLNPLTKSRRKLPSIRFPDLEPDIELFGFGYDPRFDDYKVLRVVQGYQTLEGGNKVLYEEAKLYSFNNNSWKSVEGTIPFYVFERDCHSVLVNEALHHIVFTKQPIPEANSQGHVIAKFDLRTERFSFMEYPNYVEKDGSVVMLTLTELGGCLSLIVSYHKNFLLEFVDLWVMKKYGRKESWFKLFHILSETVGGLMSVKPIAYSNDGRRILIEIDILGYGWYDLESKTVVKFTPRGLPEGNIETSKFVGSLVSLDDKLHSGRGTLPRKNKKKNGGDKFLSTGFKLKL